jgi:tetratricopeptide (TPR) repeat protein
MPLPFSPGVRQLVLAATLSAFSSLAWSAPVDDLITEAQQRVEASDMAGAYQLLSDRRFEFAGNKEFDYWLGLLAVRNGKPAEAIFPLERVLAADANHAGARLELASAYVALGQRESARRELARLEKLDPPEAAEKRIAELNDAVGRQEQTQARNNRVIFVGLEAGHDDNVGTWPEGRINFGFFSLPFEPVNSAYLAYQGGIWQRFDMNATQSVALSLNGAFRDNDQEDAEQFDQDILSGKAEWVNDLDGRHAVAVGVDAGGMDLDGEKYYRLYGSYAEWRNQVSSTRKYYARLGVHRVDFDLDEYDYQQSRLQTGVTYLLSNRWRLTADISADYEAAKNDRPGGDATVYGISSSLAYQLTSRQRVGGSGFLAYADYRRDVPAGRAFNVLPESRSDNRAGAGLFWEMYPSNSVQVRARVDYREQDSSLDIYEYDQTSGALAVSYYF